MNIAITGHRPNKLGNDYDLTSPLVLSIKNEILEFIFNLNTKELRQLINENLSNPIVLKELNDELNKRIFGKKIKVFVEDGLDSNIIKSKPFLNKDDIY